MFIQTAPTPNPATLKFLPGKPVLNKGIADFPSADKASGSPLARRLFEVEGVRGVMLGADFITVTKDEAEDWTVLKPMVLGAVMDHFTSGDPAVVEGAVEAASASDEDAIVTQIKELIETRVRPQVAQDGGDIIFQDFKDGIVTLSMRGACSGCPSATMTLKSGIENMLKYYIPEVVSVEAAEF